jgi:L-seryl-tRNA(Ser) seleniumtransferase
VTASQPDLSALPSVDGVLADARLGELLDRCDRHVLTDLVRAALADLREDLRAGSGPAQRQALTDRAVEGVRQRLARKLAPRLGRVVNATGIVLHTNLGRAPLAAAAVARVAETAAGYCDLEVDLDSGERGSRHILVEDLLCELTGAEAAAVVNNNAAAVLLTLNSLAMGREAIVSRGQLIEIGGSFRLPDVMSRSGAEMVEVGTTNRTHLADYEDAIGERTGLILDAHPSNFKVVGFTAAVSLDQLADLGRRHGVPVAHDLGGGALLDLRSLGLPQEPMVGDSVAAGVDVVTFSGDKVLGGPQAGLLVGRRASIERIRKNPMMRALRCGKLTYAALEATLRLYLDREKLLEEHPVLRMLTVSRDELEQRGRDLVQRCSALGERGWRIEVTESAAQAGSGSMPLEEIPSIAVTVAPAGLSAGELAARLRHGQPPVLGYVRDDRLHLDLRTLSVDDVDVVGSALRLAATP